MIMIILSISRPPPKTPAEEPLGMPVLGAIGGVALEGVGLGDEDLAQDVEEDGVEDSWQDSSACSPLPGDPAPLVKTKVNLSNVNSCYLCHRECSTSQSSWLAQTESPLLQPRKDLILSLA